MGTITTITPAGEVTSIEYGAPVGLEALQSAVGGFIEQVPYFSTYLGKDCIAYCNEEGKLHRLAINPVASRLWQEQPGLGRLLDDVLVGTIIILTGDNKFLTGEDQ
jgi:hypothetical protein